MRTFSLGLASPSASTTRSPRSTTSPPPWSRCLSRRCVRCVLICTACGRAFSGCGTTPAPSCRCLGPSDSSSLMPSSQSCGACASGSGVTSAGRLIGMRAAARSNATLQAPPAGSRASGRHGRTTSSIRPRAALPLSSPADAWSDAHGIVGLACAHYYTDPLCMGCTLEPCWRTRVCRVIVRATSRAMRLICGQSSSDALRHMRGQTERKATQAHARATELSELPLRVAATVNVHPRQCRQCRQCRQPAARVPRIQSHSRRGAWSLLLGVNVRDQTHRDD
mmetsp:Transcript_16844/g.33982  ORF Transcript_16844/g.33982 Transcript_16844/m.33982 type:complete len:280 (+) Transcript_16844:1-840(+)